MKIGHLKKFVLSDRQRFYRSCLHFLSLNDSPSDVNAFGINVFGQPVGRRLAAARSWLGSSFTDRVWQLAVMKPELRRGEVVHSGVQRPAS